MLVLLDVISFLLCYQILCKDGVVCWYYVVCCYIEIENDFKGYLLYFYDIIDQVEVEEVCCCDQVLLEYLVCYNVMGEMVIVIVYELLQLLVVICNFFEGLVLCIKQSEVLCEQVGQIVWGLESVGCQVDYVVIIIKSVCEYVVWLEQSEGLIDFNVVLEEVCWFIEMKVVEGKVYLYIELGMQLLVVSCEKVLIGQVILNFVFNVIEEMVEFYEGVRYVCISIVCSVGNVLLIVVDEGCGIDVGYCEWFFDGFFFCKVSGNGIGLVLCKNIIVCYCGDIWV